MDLVEAAERYLAADDLGPAVEVARAAAAASPVDRRAQLLSAIALARVRVERPDEICDWGAWPDQIEAHLQAAWALDGELIGRLHSEPDLAPVGASLPNSVAYKVWTMKGRPWKSEGPPRAVLRAGLPVRQLDGLLKRKVAMTLVPQTAWFGVGPDGVATDVELALSPEGVATRTSYRLDADGQRLPRSQTGTWRLDKAGLHLDLPGEPRLLATRVSGLWAVEDAAGQPLKDPSLRYWDRPADCRPTEP